jgi:hypothetical protein
MNDWPEVLRKLDAIEATLSNAESRYFEAAYHVAQLKERIEAKGFELYESKSLDGKNEFTREASAHKFTSVLKAELAEAERELTRLKADYFHHRRRYEIYEMSAKFTLKGGNFE